MYSDGGKFGSSEGEGVSPSFSLASPISFTKNIFPIHFIKKLFNYFFMESFYVLFKINLSTFHSSLCSVFSGVHLALIGAD